MNVCPSVKGDFGEVWGTGLCACSDKMLGNLGGWGVPPHSVCRQPLGVHFSK